ncbi:MAG TPA: helix-hairpin-helix domain-containing protein, partial [Candidatus Babeliales bacterium]|nr:helix-hairpin-helix domain-containing protein [Candidatus Babeliales bacterium]
MNNQTPTAKNNLSEISGVIDRFLFQSTENGYCVCVLQTDTAQPVTICGYLPDVHPGEQLQLRGSWTMHPKFGKQFQVEQCTKTLPTSVVGLKKYLASGLIKGIGPSYAERLVDHFGIQVLEIIDKYPERLQEVPGIGKGRATKIMLAWQDQRDISAIMVFLQEKNISPTYAIKIYKTYGQNSIAILHENPYRLADDIWGIGFKIADQIAHNLGLAKDSIKRIRAGMLFAISTEVGNGHLYVELAQLKNKSIELLELNAETADPLFKQALHELYDQDKIKLISYENRHFITLSQYYHAEKGCANKIANLLEYPTPYRFDLDQIYTMLRSENPKDAIVLNDEQQQGIMACLQHKVTIIT